MGLAPDLAVLGTALVVFLAVPIGMGYVIANRSGSNSSDD